MFSRLMHQENISVLKNSLCIAWVSFHNVKIRHKNQDDLEKVQSNVKLIHPKKESCPSLWEFTIFFGLVCVIGLVYGTCPVTYLYMIQNLYSPY